MRPESELEAEEVSFLNTCRRAFERLETVHARGRASVSMTVTMPARTVKFWCEGAAPEEPEVPGASGEWSDPARAVVGINPAVPVTDTTTVVAVDPDGIVEPLTLEQFDAIVRDGTAELPPVPAQKVEVNDSGQWNLVQYQPPPPPPAPGPPPPAPKSRKKT
jgi:hypothetical protein